MFCRLDKEDHIANVIFTLFKRIVTRKKIQKKQKKSQLKGIVRN